MAKAAKVDRTTEDSERELASRFLRFADYLQYQMTEGPKRTKGERTKDALKLGAIRVLDDVGYHAMRVSDICDTAGVSGATFYLYFKNKSEITLEVLSEYLIYQEKGVSLPPASPGARSSLEAMRAANLRWLSVVRANAGLSRCIMQLGDEEPDFRDLIHRANRQWYDRIAASVARKVWSDAPSTDVVLLAAYSLGAMMDEMARKLVVYPDTALLELAGRVAPTDEEIADFFTVLWHRALYGRLPPNSDLGAAAKAVAQLEIAAPTSGG